MAHVQCTAVQDRPIEFLDVTSLTLDAFQQLTRLVRPRFTRLWPRGASMGSRGAPPAEEATPVAAAPVQPVSPYQYKG